MVALPTARCQVSSMLCWRAMEGDGNLEEIVVDGVDVEGVGRVALEDGTNGRPLEG